MSNEPGDLVRLWRAAAAEHGDRPAIAAGTDAPLSYTEVTAIAAQIASQLRDRGLVPGGAVAVALGRTALWLPALVGIWTAGGVAVPIPAHGILRDGAVGLVGAGLCLRDDPHGGYRIEQDGDVAATVRLDPRHAYVLVTSGSTGLPKVAVVSHRTSASVLRGLVQAVGIGAGERALHTAAFTFSSSLRQLFVPVLSGAQVVVLAGTASFSPAHLLATAATAAVTSLDLTPSHLAGLVTALEADPRLPRPGGLRRLLVASEPLAPELVDRWRRAVAVPHSLVHLYGQTETGGAICVCVDADLAMSNGRLPLGRPFAPFAAQFAPAPPGEPAEMLLAGLDAADAEVVDSALDRGRYNAATTEATGLYRTGDLFEQDAAGRLYYHGRVDDQVKLAGARIDLAALERHLSGVLGGVRVLITPVDRPAGGAVLAIAYVADPPGAPGPDEVSAAATRWLAPAAPAVLVMRLDEIPLNRSGKLDRAEVREQAHAALFIPAAPTGEVVDDLAVLWARHTTAQPTLGATDATQMSFFAAGGDSLSMIGLLADVTRIFGVRILPEQFHRAPTLPALRQLVAAATSDHGPSGDQHTAGPPPASASGGSRAATALQRGIWVAEMLHTMSVSPYWLPVEITVDAILDPARLRQATATVMARFDALRLGFTGDASTTPTMHPESYGPADARLQRPPDFDATLGNMLQPGPLFRVAAADDGHHTTVALRVHHAVADRPSLSLILAALCDAYDDPDRTPAPAPSYLQWLARLDADRPGPRQDEAARFWVSSLPDPPAPGRRGGGPPTGRLAATIPAPAINDLARDTTRHAFWLWAYHCGLRLVEAPQPRLVGVDIDLRAPDQRDLVGACVTTLPVVLPESAAADGPVAAGLAVARLLPHASVPIAEVVAPARRPTGDPRQPFFHHHLVYQASGYPAVRIGGHPARHTQLPAGIAWHSSTLFVRDASGGTHLELAFDPQTIDNEHARVLLAAIVDRAAAPEGAGA